MNTLSAFFNIARPFWLNKQSWLAWLLLFLVIALSLLTVQMNVLITNWNKEFYDALENHQASIMWRLVGDYLVYIGILVIWIVLGSYLRKKLIFHWREHLAQQMQTAWLNHHRAYRLQLANEPDNPDQRIAEDAFLLAEKSIDLLKSLISNIAKLIAFIAILWELSGKHSITFQGETYIIHGYLVWIALIYTLVCTLFTHLLGRHLHHLNMERQHREADYRATLLRIRDHAEQIAFYHGEQAEHSRISKRFQALKDNWYQLIKRELHLETFNVTYLRVVMFIPIVATLPMYFARQITFGDMMQARSAFTNVQDGFGWFMDYYKRIMEWAAVVSRLADFQNALNHIDNNDHSKQCLFKHTTDQSMPASIALNVHELSIQTQSGHSLLQNLSFQAQFGEWWLLNGRSGIGKTTLLRALAGLWNKQQGKVSFHSQNILFLPQRPYLPQDTLSAVLSYPHTSYTTQQLQDVLQQVGLSSLVSQLHQDKEWHKQLSGGEQQRISLARVLLHRPSILFIDEATNQLDAQSSQALLQLLKQTLPNTLVIASSHQPEIHTLFEHTLNLDEYSCQR